jgi:O-antigen ligase
MSNKHKAENRSIWQFRIAEFLACLLAFALPLTFSAKHFYAFNSPKILLAITTVLLMVIFYLWGKWQSDGFKIKISLLGVATIIFALTLTISSFLGIDPINSFFGWGNVVPLIAIYAFIVYAFIIGALIKRNERMIPRLLLSVVASGILALVFFYTGLPAPVGKTEGSTLGNSSYVGGFLVFVISFGVALLFYFKKVWQKILITLSLLFLTINPLFINKEFLLGNISLGEVFSNPLSILGIANGGAMGVFMSLALVGILFLIFSKRKALKITGIVLALILAVGLIYTSRALVTEGTKINKIFTEEKSGNRFVAWDIAKKGYKDSPVFGNGVNNYIYNFEKYYSTDFYKKDYALEKLLEPHNVIWQFLSESGVVGLASYLILLISLFGTLLYSRKNDEGSVRLRNLRIILAASIFGYFLQNLFVFDTVNTYLPLFIIVGIALGVGCGHEIALGGNSKVFKVAKNILILLLIGGSIFLIKTLSIQGHVESKAMMGIIGETKNLSDFARLREGVNEKSYFGGMMEYTYQAEKLFKLYQRLISSVTKENKPVFLNEIKSLVSNLEETVAKQPNYGASYLSMSTMLNLYLLAEGKEDGYIKLNKNTYDKEVWEKSFLYANKAIQINSKNPINYNALSQLYMIKGDMDNAYLYAKKYLELAPEYKEAYTYARGLLKIRYNSAFENYVNEMEQKHIK